LTRRKLKKPTLEIEEERKAQPAVGV